MSYEPADEFGRPPWDEDEAHVSTTPGMAQIALDLTAAIERLAKAIDRLASAPPAAPVASGPPSAPSGPPNGTAPPGAREKTVEEKMAGKVFAICKTQGWDIADIGNRATGKPLGEDSRKWSKADLATTLDALKEWGFP